MRCKNLTLNLYERSSFQKVLGSMQQTAWPNPHFELAISLMSLPSILYFAYNIRHRNRGTHKQSWGPTAINVIVNGTLFNQSEVQQAKKLRNVGLRTHGALSPTRVLIVNPYPNIPVTVVQLRMQVQSLVSNLLRIFFLNILNTE